MKVAACYRNVGKQVPYVYWTLPNVKVQNEWLRQNIFDPMGNYLFGAPCVVDSLQLSYQRLSRQRLVKRRQSQQSILEMPKSQVESESLGEYIVMPIGCDQSFKTWWRSLDGTAQVQIAIPMNGTGAGKTSNFAKLVLWRIF